ncbi:MAG: hypothetical protein ABIQ27_07100 [Flavobacterium sp.]|uniref:hypothetical protein n=2 Tax=Flavobacterium sp. TaxID=239 RepID=UPI0032669E92
MNMSKFIGAVLILISLLIGYIGINKIDDNAKEVNLLGLRIDVSNESEKQQGYLYVGLAVLLFSGGIFVVNKTTKA